MSPRYTPASALLLIVAASLSLPPSASAQSTILYDGFEQSAGHVNPVGTWRGLARVGGNAYRLTMVFGQNGTVSDEYLNYGTRQVEATDTGTWRIGDDGHLKIDWSNYDHPYFYRVEVAGDRLLLDGGDLAYVSPLYRSKQDLGSEPQLLGQWTDVAVNSSLGRVRLYLGPDGRYWQSHTPALEDPVIETGAWRVSPQETEMVFEPDDGAPRTSTYSLSSPGGLSQLALSVWGSSLSLSRDLQPLGDSLEEVAGEYLSASATLRLAPDGTGTLIEKARGYPLTFDLAVDPDRTSYAPPYLRVNIPGVTDGDQFLSGFRAGRLGFGSTHPLDARLGGFHRRTFGGFLDQPDGMIGNWILADGDGGYTRVLTLLPGDRYWVRSRTASWGAEVRGDYTRQGERITFDPDCAAPETSDLSIGGDQLVFGSTVYHYFPASRRQIETEWPLYAAAARAEDEGWEARLPLAAVRPSDMTATQTEFGADPQPGEIFQGATVFSDAQAYTWRSPLTIARTLDGRIVSYLPEQLLTDQALANAIDYSGGTYNDLLGIYFYPNGRVLRRNVLYSTPVQIYPTITADIVNAWDRYRIDNGTVYIGGTAADILIGRRRIRLDETCYDNLEWASGN